jgi:hypothetical protein
VLPVFVKILLAIMAVPAYHFRNSVPVFRQAPPKIKDFELLKVGIPQPE